MNVVYKDSLKQTQSGVTLLEQATKQLEEIVNESSGPISAQWDRMENGKDRPMYAFTLTSPTMGEVTTTFTSDELADPKRVRFRLLDIWGDLLQFYSHKLIDDMHR